MIVEDERDGNTQYDVSVFEQPESNQSSQVDLNFSPGMPSNVGNIMSVMTIRNEVAAFDWSEEIRASTEPIHLTTLSSLLHVYLNGDTKGDRYSPISRRARLTTLSSRSSHHSFVALVSPLFRTDLFSDPNFSADLNQKDTVFVYNDDKNGCSDLRDAL
uniref:Uncharacterized protein n=1 Tax=Brassica oleracea var. oleracea TaxID=109376 RepID=A0A0D3EDR3_BRAOL